MKTRRFLAWLLMLAMVLTGIPFYADDSVAYAAASAPNLSCMTATNELTASGDALVSNSSAHVDDSYNGYIQSNQGDTDYYESDYVKITYSVSGEVTDATKVFILQTYDTSWGGWAGVEVTVGQSAYDSATGVYTTYIPTAQILSTLTTGNDLNGVNISFMQAEPVVTLLSYETLVYPDFASMTATNELSASGDALVSNSSAHAGDSYNGYIQSNEGDTAYNESDYIKITYSVSGTVTNDTKAFILQTYDTSWGGWAGLEITVGDSSYNSASGTYTAYVPTADVLATLTTGMN